MSAEGVPQGRKRLSIWTAEVFVPFATTRLALLIVAWLARYLPYNSTYADDLGASRGWAFTSTRLLDVWGRWDSNWYSFIVRDGYQAHGFAQHAWTDVAFFPLYPGIGRALYWLLPAALHTRSTAFTILVLEANVFAILALSALHRFATVRLGAEVAQRAIGYLLAFPTAFYLSTAYSESLFLFLAVLAFLYATEHRWLLAGLCGFFCATTRPPGVLIAIPLVWFYLESIQFQWRRLRPQVLSVALVPLGFLAYGIFLHRLTGDPLAIVHAQRGWARSFSLPWDTLLHPSDLNPFITPVDQASVVLFTLLGLLLLFRMPSASYGIFTLVSLAPILLSSRLNGAARYVLVLFPVFLLMAKGNLRPSLDRAILFVFTLVQGLLMFAWSQAYFVD